MFFNLGFLGLSCLVSLFDTSVGKQNIFENVEIDKHYNFYVGNLIDNYKNPPTEKLKVKKKENIFLTLKIFADKQYDYDQNIYLAEGNVKVIINNGILRSDLLIYEKSTGILSAKGNIRFRKGGQYFKGRELEFNLLKKEGTILDAYGILDVENVLNDLRIDSVSEQILSKKSFQNENTYDDGIEFSFGNIKFPKNKITRSDKSIGSINNWRFKADSINIIENGWKSNRINFTNDPFDPHQIAFEGIDVVAEEDENGKLLITSSKTNLILERRTRIFLGKRIFGDKKKNKNKFELMFDSKDRDGLTIIRRSDTTKINDNVNLQLQPQFLINRAIISETNSYINSQTKDTKKIEFSDLFGLNIRINAEYKDWRLDSINDLSTLNTSRIRNGIRHSSYLSKYLKLPILEDSNFKIFSTYRSSAWNGTIGETEIKSAYGGFIEKTHYFETGDLKNNLNIRIGKAKYEAEKLENTQMINLWRSSIFASLSSEYQIWNSNPKSIYQKDDLRLSSVLINPELVLRTNINSAYFKYEDGSDQGFLKLSLGPEIRLGRLERNFMDYTKLSVMPGFKIKSGNSPFKFDNAVDLKTLDINFMQQIYGPMMLEISSNLNIDKRSINYGEYYDTKLGLLWHKRAYECGIYFHPNNDSGGLYFRINGFKFGNSVNPEF